MKTSTKCKCFSCFLSSFITATIVYAQNSSDPTPVETAYQVGKIVGIIILFSFLILGLRKKTMLLLKNPKGKALASLMFGSASLLLTNLSSNLLISLAAAFLGIVSMTMGIISIRQSIFQKGLLLKISSCLGILFGFSCLFGLLLDFYIHPHFNAPNYEVVLRLTSTFNHEVNPSVLEETKRVISLRLKQFGLNNIIEPIEPDRLLVRFRIRGNYDEKNLKNLFPRGFLSFHLVHPNNDSIVKQHYDLNFSPPDGFRFAVCSDETLYVKKEPELVNHIQDAKVEYDTDTGQRVIGIKFKPEGAEIFKRITGANIGQRLAVMVDDVVYLAPSILGTIYNGNVSLTGGFSIEEARELAIVLSSGMIPAPVEFVEGHRLLIE
jgi:protein-export membrane protein SecD